MRLVVRALEVDLAVLQQPVDDGHRLLEPGDATVEGVAECLELRFVPAGAETEREPAAADLVDRIGHLGQ